MTNKKQSDRDTGRMDEHCVRFSESDRARYEREGRSEIDVAGRSESEGRKKEESDRI